MEWWYGDPSRPAPCFSLPLYPPGRPLVTDRARPCYPALDPGLEVVVYALGCFANAVTISLLLKGSQRRPRRHPSQKQQQSQQTGGGGGGGGRGESIPRRLVLALCATELAYLLLGETGWLVGFLAGAWPGGAPVYLLSACGSVAFHRLSRCLVVLMGGERYLSLRRPFYYDHAVTPRRVGLAILGLAGYSLAMAGFFAAGVTTRTWPHCPTSTADLEGSSSVPTPACVAASTAAFVPSPVETAYEWLTALESALMTGALLASNAAVVRCMQRLRAHLRVACPRNRAEYVKQVDMVRGAPADFSRLMVAVAGVFTLCTLPYEIRWVANHLNTWESPTLDYIAVRLYLSTCLINPLLYGVFRRKVGRKIKEGAARLLAQPCVCCGPCKRKNRVRPQEATTTDAPGQWQVSSTVSASVELVVGGGPC